MAEFKDFTLILALFQTPYEGDTIDIALEFDAEDESFAARRALVEVLIHQGLAPRAVVGERVETLETAEAFEALARDNSADFYLYLMFDLTDEHEAEHNLGLTLTPTFAILDFEPSSAWTVVGISTLGALVNAIATATPIASLEIASSEEDEAEAVAKLWGFPKG